MIGKGMYNTFGLNNNADLIIADGNNYYNCYLMPGINNAEDVATEQLAYWRIEKIEKTEQDGIVTYKRLYPEGSSAYAFIASQYKEYTYLFKK